METETKSGMSVGKTETGNLGYQERYNAVKYTITDGNGKLNQKQWHM
jgi:hypothetical protein